MNVASSSSSYYLEKFPYTPLVRWLTLSGGDVFLKEREFAFTIQIHGGATRMHRHVYVRDEIDLRRVVRSRNVLRIDIGAVGCGSWKEFVIDIDISDYDKHGVRDAIRECVCNREASEICAHCWKILADAHDVCDKVLEEKFGFTQRLWVFSGRRGIHCWVSDRVALYMSDKVRTSIIGVVSSSSAAGKISPRVDIKVSEKASHLLKSPFSLHPATGNVCVPLCGTDIRLFDPKRVPSIGNHFFELVAFIGNFEKWIEDHRGVAAVVTEAVAETGERSVLSAT